MKFLKYQKAKAEKQDHISTSVSIEREQKEFIDKYNINLSQLVRDSVKALILDFESRSLSRAKDKKE